MRDSSLRLIASNRDLRGVWLGELLSQAGTRMYQIALAWWIVSSANGSAGVHMGLLLVFSSLPALVLAGPIGRLVDRERGRRLIRGANAAALAVTAAFGAYLALAVSAPPLALVYAVGAALALFQAVIDPTLSKMAPLLVRPGQVERAVAWMGSTQSIASFLGAICGALLVERLGLAGAIWVNAGARVLALACTLGVRDVVAPGHGEAGPSGPVWHELPRAVRRLLVSFAAMNFFMTPILVVLPVYVNRALGGTASLFAGVEGALWVGLVAGTFLAEHWKSERGGMLAAGSRLALASGACLGASALYPSGMFLGFWMAAFGVALGAANVKFLTYFQQEVPDQRKGRFFALLGAMTNLTFPVAFFLFGWLADRASSALLIGVQGLGIVAVGVYALALTGRPAPAPEAAS